MALNYGEKTLSKSDLEKLALRSQWVGEGRLLPALAQGLEAEAVLTQAWDESWKNYNFMMKVRSQPAPDGGPRRYYRKPVFRRRDWRAFVVEKGLRAGDKIYFWREAGGFLRVKARQPPRTFRLFGVNILY